MTSGQLTIIVVCSFFFAAGLWARRCIKLYTAPRWQREYATAPLIIAVALVGAIPGQPEFSIEKATFFLSVGILLLAGWILFFTREARTHNAKHAP